MKARHVAVAAALVAVAGCGGGNRAPAVIKANQQAPACSTLYADGASIKAAFIDYPPCKTASGELHQYAPSTNKCSDSRWLYWSDEAQAWGYSDGTVHAGALPAGEQGRCAG